MARKRYTQEQIIGMLRQAEVRLSQGEKVGAISRSLGISEQSHDRWRKEYGGLKVSQARRLKDLEKENQRLRRRAGIGCIRALDWARLRCGFPSGSRLDQMFHTVEIRFNSLIKHHFTNSSRCGSLPR